MSAEAMAIVGLTVVALALPVMGAWVWQAFALKTELREAEARADKTEARLMQRLDRIEDEQKRMLAAFQHAVEDMGRAAARVEGRLDVVDAVAKIIQHGQQHGRGQG